MAAEPQAQTDPEIPEDVVAHSPRYADFAAALVSKGKMRESEVIRAHRLALQTDDPRIPALLVKLGIISERDTAEILADVSGVVLVTPEDYPETSPLPETISIRFLKENHIIGLSASDEEVVMPSPTLLIRKC